MPTVDMPVSQPGSSNKEGFGTGLPTPILLAIVGGGIGLVVFLTRKSGTPSDSQSGTLLPNTAIMLGSLQQGILDLQGKVSTGNADLSSQLTGVGENLGAQIDAQTAQTQQAFTNLNSYLQTSMSTLQGNEDALSTAIATLGTQNAGLAQSLGQILANVQGARSQLSDIYTQNQNISGQVAMAYGAGQQSYAMSQQSYRMAQQAYQQAQQVMGGVNTILQGQNVIQSQVDALGRQVAHA
jgi:hypothetical protein